MEVALPKIYEQHIKNAVRTLKRGFASKDDYQRIDDQAQELKADQAYVFIQRIRDDLVESLKKHSEECQHPDTCAESLGSEQAINSMNKRLDEMEKFIEPISFKYILPEQSPIHPQNTQPHVK